MSEDEKLTAVYERARRLSDAVFRVDVVGGPDKGMTVTLDEKALARVLVGTSPFCDLRLTDATVSRRHLALEHAGDRLRVSDLGSTNGTVVSGVAVERALASGGEIVEIGQTRLVVTRTTTAERSPGGPPASDATSFGRYIGASPVMQQLYPLCERVASSALPVLIEGETGTGKEVLAEGIHERGPRANQPFVVFDCTTVPASLIEATLFGYDRGAFTGATSARPGIFEEAHTGTLLIDEIGDLDLTLQPKLLRAIQRSEVRRLGSDKWIKIDVRIIAATRRNLDLEVQAGRFRDDLFFRLAVARIELPPLRDRQGDVPLLALHFWRTLGGRDETFPTHALDRLVAYGWPGNVRELHNAVSRLFALGELASTPNRSSRFLEPPVASEAVPSSVPGSMPVGHGDFLDSVLREHLPLVRARERVVEEFERRYVRDVLERHDGSVVRAAAASGLARRYFRALKARRRDES